MGLPVVCSDAGGLPENVEHEVTGFVVRRRDAAGIAERLAQLVADPALRRRMGRAARVRAESVLGEDHQLDGFEALYQELLAEPRQDVVPDAPVQGGRVAALREELAALESRSQALRLQLWRGQVVEEVRRAFTRQLPAGRDVLVVSRGDEEIVALGANRGGHFPQSADGAYAGHHPADSGEAIAHLEALCRAGARYLVIPATAAWWLEHYAGFAEHLDARHERLPGSEEHFVAYALRDGSAADGARTAPREALV
jgi:hypothetical protein